MTTLAQDRLPLPESIAPAQSLTLEPFIDMERSLAAPSVEDAELRQLDRPLRAVRLGAAVVLALVAAMLAWMALAPLSGAVIGAGVVKVDSNRKTVQHQEGGIVSEVLVRNGDKVRAGQPLLLLGDVRVDAQREMARTQLDSEMARAARLEAERTGAAQVVFPAALGERAREPRVAELLARENALFNARRQSLHDQLHLVDQQVEEIQREIEARDAQSRVDASSRDLAREELAANEALVAQGFVSKVRLMNLKRGEADYAAREQGNKAELAQARQRVVELRLRAAGLRHGFMQEATDEHKRTSAQIFDLQERLRTWDDQEARQRIVAPVAGEIVDLKVNGPGSVIGPRDAILDIVPENADLIVEAQVRPEDINYVGDGAEADVRLTAYKQRITPVVAGSVTYVSADRLEDKATRQPYYAVQVKVSAQSLREAGDLKLQAGMPAEVFIKTASYSALEYLLAPVTSFLRHSMREP